MRTVTGTERGSYRGRERDDDPVIQRSGETGAFSSATTDREVMAATGIEQLRTVADYQFGTGAGAALFPPDEGTTIRRSTSGRPQQVLTEAGRIVSYGVDGRFTLGIEGGRRLVQAFPAPRCRVAVGAESVPFVSDGKNAFCKFVREADPAIRPGDEVLVVYDDAESESRNDDDPEGASGNDGEDEGSDGGNDRENEHGDEETGNETDSEDRADGENRETTAEPGALLAVGRAELAADTMYDFETGMAVKVRSGVGAFE